MSSTFTVIVDGLAFPEAPRWHDDALWFSDIHDHKVYRLGEEGVAHVVASVPGRPSGLGFLPDGRMLVVSMLERKVLRVDPGGLALHADLSSVASWHTNDMVVDASGRAYVGNHGDGSSFGQPITPANLAVVGVDGGVSAAASGMMLANGMALLEGGTILAVAETRAQPPRVTLFDVDSDGALSGRRELIVLDDEAPDGICVDPDGNVWVASPLTREVLCVNGHGKIVRRLPTPQAPLSCVFGGSSGARLYICESDAWGHAESVRRKVGRVVAIDL